MKRYYVDVNSVYNDVCNWEQSKDELTRWNKETIRAELETIDFPEDENGYTIDEITNFYFEAVKKLVSTLE